MRVHYLPVIAADSGLALSTSVANADVFNKKTKLTFSQPVRVPGKTFSAGSYFFKLVDSQSNRNIIQITNVREDRVYATILALPDYRLNPNSHTVVTFGETGAGCASAVKAWFYPGDNAGNRFVYGKKEAAEMAKSCQQPVPSVPTEVATKAVTAPPVKESNSTEPAVVALVQAPVKTETAQAQTVDYAQSTYEKQDLSDRSGVSGEVPSAPAAKLPKSASDIPTYAALGALLLTAGAAGRVLTRRSI